jgi:leucyl-tRNA synthetase
VKIVTSLQNPESRYIFLDSCLWRLDSNLRFILERIRITLMNKYIPKNIEPKWQKKWLEDKLYEVNLEEDKEKYYLLVELPYTSGDLHIGHWFAFGVVDSIARYKRMQGLNVFFPIGFDSFGLPAENAAIKRGLNPKDWTLSNIESMKKQFHLMGSVLSWQSEVITCLPEYYKWNQWIFLKMYQNDIAYRGKVLSNWCPSCQTVLADEQVVAGKCDRCGTEVTKKEIDQWLLRITSYADKLEWKEGGSGVDWPQETMQGQNNWIGRSEGVLLKFTPSDAKKEPIEVFTTRIDTIFGATFLVISPEHPLLNEYVTKDQSRLVSEYIETANRKSELERKENKLKTGVFTGSYVINPLNKEKIPVWVADYVLMGYGTGAIMAVPAHDERDFAFAKKFGLDIEVVVRGPASSVSRRTSSDIHPAGVRQDLSELSPLTTPFEEEGILINSGEYTGMSSAEAREKLSKYIEDNQLGKIQINYHLHDWSISRQRYWGTPIPIIHCDPPAGGCGVVPVPEADLPVELPEKVDYAPKGKSPLALAEDWIKVKCPKCGGEARRDTDTMDGFVDNSWYFMRYLDPKNDLEISSMKYLENWLPIDIYFGGSEHTLGHTLYSRFFYKFLVDIKAIPDASGIGEYAKRRYNHGVILGPDGARMSKSKGNVINPDEQVKDYGADAVRLYLGFIGPYDIVAPWNPSGINGIYNFLQRVWKLEEKVFKQEVASSLSEQDLRIMHSSIKRVTDDLNQIKFNTAIAGLMEWLNYLSKKQSVSKEEYKAFLLLLAPFAPHITEELWQVIGESYSIHQQPWPKFDEKYLVRNEVLLVIQVNGKVREKIMITSDIVGSKEKVEKIVLQNEKIKNLLIEKTVKNIVYIPGKIVNIVTD